MEDTASMETPAPGSKIELAPGLTAQAGQPLRILELGAGTGIVSLALARLLQDRKLPSGLPDIHVVMTDKANVLPLLQKNLDSNRPNGPHVRLEALVLDWEHYSGVQAKDTAPPLAANKDKDSDGSDNNDTKSTSATTPVAQHGNDDKDFVKQAHLDQVRHWDLIIVSDCIWITDLHAPLNATIAKLVPKEPAPHHHHKTKILTAFERRDFAKEMEFFAQLGREFRFRDVKPEEMDPNWQSEDIYIFIAERRD